MIDAIRRKYGGRLPPPVPLTDRQWPSKVITKCPTFLSSDLRDGNQALPNPMTFEQKLTMFKLLVSIGIKEIEVAYAGASKIDFDFVRYLVETPSLVPDDVLLQVIAPCREDALKLAVESLHGAKKASLFTYLACSDNLRETVLQMTEDEWVERARTCSAYARSLIKDGGPYAEGTDWIYSFGFEDFPNSRPEAVVRCAEAIKSAWKPTKDDKMVLGVAASLEVATPNVFADQVEYLLRNLSGRDTFRFAVHPHNDRGCAVAAAELACLAGADRVDGCLFGNGERAGNVDMIVIALNALTMGFDPGLDLSHLDEVRKIYEGITNIPVHPRTPYSGDFYFRAFSGAHQDAISKGLKVRNTTAKDQSEAYAWPAWRVPYLPLDPADLGRSMEDCVVGINSQSGKGGVAWVLRQRLGLEKVPADLLRVFSKVIKDLSEQVGRGIGSQDVCCEFCKVYHTEALTIDGDGAWLLENEGKRFRADKVVLATLVATADGEALDRALSQILGLRQQLNTVITYEKLDDSILSGDTAAYAKCMTNEVSVGTVWGVGIGKNERVAAVRAVLSALLIAGHVVIQTGKYQVNDSRKEQLGISRLEILTDC